MIVLKAGWFLFSIVANIILFGLVYPILSVLLLPASRANARFETRLTEELRPIGLEREDVGICPQSGHLNRFKGTVGQRELMMRRYDCTVRTNPPIRLARPGPWLRIRVDRRGVVGGFHLHMEGPASPALDFASRTLALEQLPEPAAARLDATRWAACSQWAERGDLLVDAHAVEATIPFVKDAAAIKADVEALVAFVEQLGQASKRGGMTHTDWQAHRSASA